MDALARVCDRIVVEVAEDRVEQRIVAIDRRVARKYHLCRDLLFLYLLRTFLFDLADQFPDVHFRQFEHLGSLVQAVQHRNVAQQPREPRALRVAAFEEEPVLVVRQLRVADDRFEVALDAADGSFQLVRHVLRQLPFHPALFLLAGYVVDGNLVAVVEEQDAFDQENLPVLVHRDRFAQHFPLAVRVRDVFGEEHMDRFQFRDVDRVLRLPYLHVGNQVRELYELDVGQYLPPFRREHGKALFRVLEMLDQLLAFHRKLVFRLLLAVVKPDDVLRNVPKLVVWKDIFVLRYAVFLHIQGEVAQFRDRPPDAERETGEDEEEYQRHQCHKVDEILVDRQHTLRVGVPGEGGTVDVLPDIRRCIEVTLARRVGRADGKPFIVEACLAHFAAVVMVVELLGAAIVEQHFPRRVDNRDAKVLLRDVVDEPVDHLIDIFGLLRAAKQLVVVIS